MIVVGKLKIANLIQYLPMPVIGGYLAFIGFFCGQAGLSLMANVDDWLPLAAQDDFEYVVGEVIAHRPERRALPGRRRLLKSDFEFQVRWADLPEGEDNPSWEPWSNQSLRESAPFQEYLQRPEVIEALGRDFSGAEEAFAILRQASGRDARERCR